MNQWFDGQAWSGGEAVDQTCRLLAPVPGALKLANDVGAFYGSNFRLSTYPKSRHACFEAYGVGDTAHIRLGLASSRVVESLIHELLHADLLRLGFPRFSIPDTDENRRLYFNHYDALNYVQHELMFPMFVGLGFVPSRFLAQTQPQFRNQQQVITETNQDYADKAFWCRQWSFDRQTSRLTGNDSHSKWTTEWLQDVVKKHPSIPALTKRVDNWLLRSEFSSPSVFRHSFDEYCSICDMATVQHDHWFRLKAGTASPTVVRLNVATQTDDLRA